MRVTTNIPGTPHMEGGSGLSFVVHVKDDCRYQGKAYIFTRIEDLLKDKFPLAKVSCNSLDSKSLILYCNNIATPLWQEVSITMYFAKTKSQPV